jgi:hypothetical protein
MSDARTCVDCGCQYIYDSNLKKGASTRRCVSCSKRHAKQTTKRLMLEAAGGKCRSCGYKRSLDAITFVDPIERLKPIPIPTNREEKIEWASQRIALCLNCAKEIEGRYLTMHIEDKKARPPLVIFATDVATIIEKAAPLVATTQNTGLTTSVGPITELEFDVLPPEPKGAEGFRGEAKVPPK